MKTLTALALLALTIHPAYAEKTRLEIAKEVRDECTEFKIWGMEPGGSDGMVKMDANETIDDCVTKRMRQLDKDAGR